MGEEEKAGQIDEQTGFLFILSAFFGIVPSCGIHLERMRLGPAGPFLMLPGVTA